MTLKLRRKPLITHRRISAEPGRSVLGFVKKNLLPRRLSMMVGLLAFCASPSILQAGDYPVRQAVFVESPGRAPTVQIVSYTSAATENTPLSQGGAELKWIPVHASQGREVQRTQTAAKPVLQETASHWQGAQSDTVVLTPIPVQHAEAVPVIITAPENYGVRQVSNVQMPRREAATAAFIPVADTRTRSSLPLPGGLGAAPGLGALAGDDDEMPAALPMEEFGFPQLPDAGVDMMNGRDSAASPRAIGSPDLSGSERNGRTGTAPTFPRDMNGDSNILPPSGVGAMPPSTADDDDPWKRFHQDGYVEDRCPSSRDMKPIREITNNIKPPEGIFPTTCPLVTNDEVFPVRQFAGTQFTWTASNLCHNPLYFEQPDLERYGHTAGPVLQPILSAGQFLLTIPMLPSLIAIEPVNECQYPLGHYRPGSCAPYKWNPLPVSMRSAIAEGGIITALVFLIP